MVNEIRLKILGIFFESERYFFRDDGFVEDIHTHAKKINEEFGDDPLSYVFEVAPDGNLPEVGGLTRVRLISHPPIPVISFYLHYDSPLKEIFVRGHEETHALEHIQRRDLLQEKISSEGLNVDLESNKDSEFIADIGGLYAVIKRGFEPNKIIEFLEKGSRTDILNVYIEFLESKSRYNK